MYFTDFVFVAFMIHQAEAPEPPRLVYPRLLEERSAEGRLLLHVHDGLVLSLRRATVAAPRVRVLTSENGRSVTQFHDGDEINRNLYEDENKLASLEITKRQTGVTMFSVFAVDCVREKLAPPSGTQMLLVPASPRTSKRGLVGPHYRIQPMPVMEKSGDGVVPHFIHEIEHSEFLDKVLTAREENETVIEERRFGSSAELPDTVYIELFVVASKPHHHRFSKTEHLIWYICVMTNFANLRLAQLSAPSVKLVLVGMEKNQEEPYALLVDDEFLFDEPTIKDFKSYATRKKVQYGNPDIVFFLSGYDVFTIYNGKVTTAGLGISYLSGLCTEFYVGLGEDMPGLFSGAHTLTHEVAHLLGATHDGDGPDSNVPGHPSAVSCEWKAGNIMSYVNSGHAHHLFSECSLRQMQYVVSLRGKACWVYKGEAHFVRGTYPGMAVTFEEFCMGLVRKKKDLRYASVSVNTTSCKVHCRYKKDSGDYYYSYHEAEEDALDYMPCGDNGEVCIKGYCVRKPTEEVKTTRPYHPTTTAEPSNEPAPIPSYCNPGCQCYCSSSGTFHLPKNHEDIHLRR